MQIFILYIYYIHIKQLNRLFMYKKRLIFNLLTVLLESVFIILYIKKRKFYQNVYTHLHFSRLL